MSPESNAFDAVIVGGGPAGLSAALTLGRSCRRVLVAADGPTRNVRAHAAHNIFTRDGTPPAELLRIARDQLGQYDVSFREERVIDSSRSASGFTITFASGETIGTRGLILAFGVRDLLPDVPGMRELWGTGVFHCPYCHGWEVRDQPLAIYAKGEKAMHLAKLLRGWTSDLMLFTDGPPDLSDAQLAQLERNGIVIRKESVARLVGRGDQLEAVVLQNGESIARAGLLVGPDQEPGSDLPQRLGCPLTAQGRVESDAFGRTSVPMLFVAGDIAGGMQAVPAAAAGGASAGAQLNLDLLEADFIP